MDDEQEQAAQERPTKQVIVIRRDLKMRRGKEIAQGAHASMAWLRQRIMPHITPAGRADQVQFSTAERSWLELSMRKVTVKVGSEQELLDVYDKALAAGLVVAVAGEAEGQDTDHGQHTSSETHVNPSDE